MKPLLTVLMMFLSLNLMLAQVLCENGVSVLLPSYSESHIQFDHPGEFNFQPAAGQQTHWEISTTSNSTVVAEGFTEIWLLDLPPNGLSIADSVVVDLTVTNTTGDVCVVKDTLIWTVVLTLPFDPPVEVFGWEHLEGTANGGTLPVELIDFRAKLVDQKAQLSWNTVAEVNNEGFEIQKSSDGRGWESLGFVDGVGTTFEQSSYQFEDRKLYPGINYYRLKQMDYSSAFSYSQIVALENDSKEKFSMKIFPIPSSGNITILTDNEYDARLEIFNVTGQIVEVIPSQSGTQVHEVNLTTPGIYYVRSISGNRPTVTRKILIH